jgi:hypothetical protein
LGDARFFPHVGNNVQHVRGAWHKGGGGGTRHQQKASGTELELGEQEEYSEQKWNFESKCETEK